MYGLHVLDVEQQFVVNHTVIHTMMVGCANQVLSAGRVT